MIFYLIIIVIILGVVVELSLRRYIWRNSFRNILVRSNNKLLSYELRPNFRRFLKNKTGKKIYYESNSLGLRNPEISKTKTKKRILIIGDSIVYGFGVNDVDTFPRQIEKKLKGYKNCEVINAGVGPYNIIQIYNLFKSKLLKLDPDLVILAINISNFIKYSDWYWDEKSNNLKLRYPQLGSFKVNSRGPLEGKAGLLGKYVDRIYIFRYYIRPFILSLIQRNNQNQSIKIGNADALNKFVKYYSKKGKIWDERKRYIKMFSRLCKEREMGFITVTFPLAAQYEEGEKGYPQEVIEKYCKQIGVYNLNLFKLFELLINSQKDVNKFFFDFIHLTPKGNKLATQEITNFILKNKLI